MIETMRRVLKLQPQYSLDTQSKTAMQERGRLLKRDLFEEFNAISGRLSEALGRFGADFHVQASDGQGLKSELPWLRFFSKEMSPGPREGYCVVVYFSTDGSAVHVTIGCGASKCVNGSFSSLPRAELERRTRWAKRAIKAANGSVGPFMDTPDYGATKEMGRRLQRATVVAKRIPVEELDDSKMVSYLVDAAALLRLIYEAQADGRDVSHADLQEHVSHQASGKRRRGSGQGFRISPGDRRLVEQRAMRLVEKRLKELQFRVRDTSANHPYDFMATKEGARLKIEVKGTTSDEMGAISMTRNEVDLHRKEKGRTALFVVVGIRLVGRDDDRRAEGGTVKPFLKWNIDDWRVEPSQYRVEPPASDGDTRANGKRAL